MKVQVLLKGILNIFDDFKIEVNLNCVLFRVPHAGHFPLNDRPRGKAPRAFLTPGTSDSSELQHSSGTAGANVKYSIPTCLNRCVLRRYRCVLKRNRIEIVSNEKAVTTVAKYSTLLEKKLRNVCPPDCSME